VQFQCEGPDELSARKFHLVIGCCLLVRGNFERFQHHQCGFVPNALFVFELKPTISKGPVAAQSASIHPHPRLREIILKRLLKAPKNRLLT
jgi:hypothetical protein